MRSTALAVLLLVASIGGARAQAPASGPDTLVRQTRVALAHGALDEAKRLASGTGGSAASRAVAGAIVDAYEGRDDQALNKLQALVAAGAKDDAILELGLVLIRHGKRSDAERVLTPLIQDLSDTQGEEGFRAARAAHALRQYDLANSIFQRLGSAISARQDVQAAWGDLFQEKHNFGEAAKSFKDALTADPAWIPAYIGLARALDEDEKASAAARDEAAKRAPNDPDVLLMMAEEQIAQTNWAAAAPILDKVAGLRPNTAREFALRAALALGQGRQTDVESALAKALAINPQYSEGYRLVGRIAASLYRFDEALAFVRKGFTLDDNDAGLHADAGLYLLRTGDEKIARDELERAFKLDPFDVPTYNLLTMLDTLEKFEVVTSGPFIFKFDKSEAAILKPYALPLADEAYKTFSEHFGFKPPDPIIVEVFSRHADFAVRTTGLEGIYGALGACFGRVVTMDSPRARLEPGSYSFQATMWHELAHVFTLQLSKYRVPRWLTEGISQNEEHRHTKPWGRELTMEYAHELAAGRTFGFKNIAIGFKSMSRLALAYFESSLIVEHLLETGGDAPMRAVLVAYGDGLTDEQAFRKAYNKSLDEIDASFKAWASQKYGALAKALADPPPVPEDNLDALKLRAGAQPGSFAAQLSLGRALLKADDLPGARAALRKAADLAPDAMGADSPRALLAEIALHDGDTAAAMNNLSELIAVDHYNTDAGRKLAALALDAKAVDKQRAGLALVTAVDPYDASAHTAYGRLALAAKDTATALVEFQAAMAAGPTNLAEAHTDLGEAYLAVGKKDEAKKEAFLALEQAPTFARAQDLLLAALGKSEVR